MIMSTIMVVSSAKQSKSERYILHDVTLPFKVEEYEEIPAGYISFPSFEDYKKIKNIDKTI